MLKMPKSTGWLGHFSFIMTRKVAKTWQTSSEHKEFASNLIFEFSMKLNFF